MSCGYLLDIIPLIREGYMTWSGDMIHMYYTCVILA